MRPILYSLAVVVWSACSTTPALPPMLRWEAPAAPAPASGWSRYTTTDFTLVTDLDPADGREAAEAMAKEFVGLRAMMGAAPVKYRTPVRIFVLADGLEFERAFGRLTAGQVATFPGQVQVFLWGKPVKWERRASRVEGQTSLITHEIAHVILGEYFPFQPRWFAEGFAQFLESYAWSADGKQVEFGLANAEAYTVYRKNRAVGAADIFAWKGGSATDAEARNRALYGYSWALVHYLINAVPERFGEVLGILARADGQAIEDANRAVSTDPGELDRQVHGYMKSGQYSVITVDVPVTQLRAAQAPLEASEVANIHQMLEQRAKALSR